MPYPKVGFGLLIGSLPEAPNCRFRAARNPKCRELEPLVQLPPPALSDESTGVNDELFTCDVWVQNKATDHQQATAPSAP